MARLYIAVGIATAVVTAAMVLAARLPPDLCVTVWVSMAAISVLAACLATRYARGRGFTEPPPVLRPGVQWKITAAALSLWILSRIARSVSGVEAEIIVAVVGTSAVLMVALSSAMKRSR